MKFETLTKSIILLLLLGYSASKISDMVSKYFAGNTAIAIKKEPFRKIRFPEVTVCSGIRDFVAMLKDLETGDGSRILDDTWLKSHLFNQSDFVSPKSLWNGNTINLIEGRCSTYKHPYLTSGGEEDGFNIRIRIPEGFNEEKFPVFFHHEDEFFFSQTHKFISNSVLIPRKGQSSFVIVRKETEEMLDKPLAPCNQTSSLKQWKQCIYAKIQTDRKCKFGWQTEWNINDYNLPICNASSILKRIQKDSLDSQLPYLDEHRIYLKTGCLRPCFTTKYPVEVANFAAKYNESVAKLTIYYQNSFVDHHHEYVTYGGFKLISEVGGLLGLVLGCSAYSVLAQGIQWFGNKY